MTLALRQAERPDIAAIAAIWHAGWVDGHLGHVDSRLVEARTPASFLARAERCVRHTTVAATSSSCDPGSDVAGFVTVVEDEVEQIYVDAQHRGSGCAGLLLRAAELQIAGAGMPSAWLAVVAGNDRARSFYEKHGWTDAGPTVYMAAGARDLDARIPVTAHRYEKQLDHVGRSRQL